MSVTVGVAFSFGAFLWAAATVAGVVRMKILDKGVWCGVALLRSASWELSLRREMARRFGRSLFVPRATRGGATPPLRTFQAQQSS